MEFELKLKNGTGGTLTVQASADGFDGGSDELFKKIQSACLEYMADINQKMFCVFMGDIGPNKIGCIKFIRAYTGLGLKEVADLVNVIPGVVAKDMSRSRAKTLTELLVGIGATAHVCNEKTLVMM